MSQFYLIDGYNLLHALGVSLPKQAGPHVLEKARGRLLALIATAHDAEAGPVTVVFDARHAPPDLPPVQHVRQVEVLFAVQHASADELIAERIRQHSSPRRLIVVSDDHQVQQAARRRRCRVMKCATYLDWLGRRHPQGRSPAAEPEKQENLSERELRHWLEEFRDLAEDPSLKELNPFDFFED